MNLDDKYIWLARTGESLTNISAMLNLFPSQTSKLFLAKTGIKFFKHRLEGFLEHLELVRNGELHIYQVREIFRFSPISFYSQVEKIGRLDAFYKEKPLIPLELQRLREGLGIFARTDIDSLLDSGLNLSKTSLNLSELISKQAIGYYVKGSGQYTYYLSKKRKVWGMNYHTKTTTTR